MKTRRERRDRATKSDGIDTFIETQGLRRESLDEVDRKEGAMKPQGPNLLVVDDEQVVCDSCARILGDRGFSVETTTDPSKALTLATENDYAVILLDIKMPTIDGFEFLEELRRKHRHVRVVMITGYPTPENAMAAGRLGVVDFVPKPFSPDELLKAVTKSVPDKESGTKAATDSTESAAAGLEPAPDLALDSTLGAAIQPAPKIAPSRTLSNWISKVSITNRDGKTVNMLVPDETLLSYEGVGLELRNLISSRNYPVTLTLGPKKLDALDIIKGIDNCDLLLLLEIRDTGRIPGSITIAPGCELLKGMSNHKIKTITVQPNVGTDGALVFDACVSGALAESILKEMTSS